MESAEFQQLLRLARSGASVDRGPLTAQITGAEYEAALAGDHLLSGRAFLQITHRGQSATILPLDPCNTAIQHAAWLLPGQDPNAETQQTILGLSREGKQQIVVRESGKLTFDWSLTGHGDAGEGIVFFCEFPLCPATVLRLELPQNLTPTVDKGVVSGVEPARTGFAGGASNWEAIAVFICAWRMTAPPARTRPWHC